MTMIYENFRLALFSLKANKMRALLTMLGIIIGISSVIAIMTVGDSLSSTLSTTMEGFGANNIECYLDFRPEYDGEYYYEMEDLFTKEMIADMANKFEGKIKAISLTNNIGSAEVAVGKKTAKVSLMGYSAGAFYLNNIKLIKGRYIKESENSAASKVCIASDKFVDMVFGGDKKAAIGSAVPVDVDGKTINFTIVGIYEYQNIFAGMGMSSGENVRTNMYIPYKTSETLNRYNNIFSFDFMAEQGIEQDQLINEVQDFFNTHYYANNDRIYTQCYSMSGMLEEVQSMLGAVTLGISLIAGIALLVGGIGVMNIMLVSITERTREIGTRKALGAPNSSIRLQFIIESIVICVIGGIIGIIVGCILGMSAAALLKCNVAPSLKGIIISLSFSMAIGIFFGYYPANKAAKMDPIEALRYE